jgi:hypothetical protein
VFGEQTDEPGWLGDGPATRPGFDVIEDQPAVSSLRAPAGMPGTIRRTRWWAGALGAADTQPCTASSCGSAGHTGADRHSRVARFGAAMLGGPARSL